MKEKFLSYPIDITQPLPQNNILTTKTKYDWVTNDWSYLVDSPNIKIKLIELLILSCLLFLPLNNQAFICYSFGILQFLFIGSSKIFKSKLTGCCFYLIYVSICSVGLVCPPIYYPLTWELSPLSLYDCWDNHACDNIWT